MKMYCASISHETNSFSPLATTLDNFRESLLYLPASGEGQAAMERAIHGKNILTVAEARGHTVVKGPMAMAMPSAPMRETDYHVLRDTLVAELKKALPVDMVVLFLHGAQMSERTDDCAGDILEQVRAVVGENVPIGVELDLHCNITERMIRNSSVLVACKEYPHIDFGDRGEDLIILMERIAKGEVQPVTALARVPMFCSFQTEFGAMRAMVDDILEQEGRDGILSITLAQGFAWADMRDAGACVIVTADRDEALAHQLADELAQRFFALRTDCEMKTVSIEEAIDSALAGDKTPVVFADVSDNPGGGAAGDSTFVLDALLKRRIDHAVVGVIWDPIATQLATQAGVGARIPLRIGGKIGPGSGAPIDVMAHILGVSDDIVQDSLGSPLPLGSAAHIRVDGVDIVINALRQQTMSPECFTGFGIDLRAQRIIAIKASQHFYATFKNLTTTVYYVDTPGTVTRRFKPDSFKNIVRPKWPLDEPPFAAFGRKWT